ncbi:unnamed protein product [Mucor hiemalis]
MTIYQLIAVLCISSLCLAGVNSIPLASTLHYVCSQNAVCSADTYCRKGPSEVYGFCEDPKLVAVPDAI